MSLVKRFYSNCFNEVKGRTPLWLFDSLLSDSQFLNVFVPLLQNQLLALLTVIFRKANEKYGSKKRLKFENKSNFFIAGSKLSGSEEKLGYINYDNLTKLYFLGEKLPDWVLRFAVFFHHYSEFLVLSRGLPDLHHPCLVRQELRELMLQSFLRLQWPKIIMKWWGDWSNLKIIHINGTGLLVNLNWLEVLTDEK